MAATQSDCAHIRVGARVSSNSFGPIGDKQFFRYDGGGFTCYTYDLYARDVPDLLHVFAAGKGGLRQTSIQFCCIYSHGLQATMLQPRNNLDEIAS
jgi:hypothetical protein